jgi:hypothetical protein
MPNSRSAMIRIMLVDRTGVASTMTRLVAYMAQTNSGRRNQVMPGARSMWTEAMKLTPVRMEVKPTTKMPMAASETMLSE